MGDREAFKTCGSGMEYGEPQESWRNGLGQEMELEVLISGDTGRRFQQDGRTANSTDLFSFMQLKRPKLSPRLYDYLIANAIERLASRG